MTSQVQTSQISLEVNGQSHALTVEHRATLLDILRESLDLTGANPVPVLRNVNTKASGAVNFSLSREGSLVYLPSSPAAIDPRDQDRSFVWVDREGRDESIHLQALRALISSGKSPADALLERTNRDAPLFPQLLEIAKV